MSFVLAMYRPDPEILLAWLSTSMSPVKFPSPSTVTFPGLVNPRLFTFRTPREITIQRSLMWYLRQDYIYVTV